MKRENEQKGKTGEVTPEELEELRQALNKVAALREALEKEEKSGNPGYKLSVDLPLLLWFEVRTITSVMRGLTGKLNYILGVIAVAAPVIIGLLIAIIRA